MLNGDTYSACTPWVAWKELTCLLVKRHPGDEVLEFAWGHESRLLPTDWPLSMLARFSIGLLFLAISIRIFARGSCLTCHFRRHLSKLLWFHNVSAGQLQPAMLDHIYGVLPKPRNRRPTPPVKAANDFVVGVVLRKIFIQLQCDIAALGAPDGLEQRQR